MKVKIVDIRPHQTHPIIFARLIEVGSEKEISSGGLLDMFRILELYKEKYNYECINLSKDRFGFPCVVDV